MVSLFQFFMSVNHFSKLTWQFKWSLNVLFYRHRATAKLNCHATSARGSKFIWKRWRVKYDAWQLSGSHTTPTDKENGTILILFLFCFIKNKIWWLLPGIHTNILCIICIFSGHCKGVYSFTGLQFAIYSQTARCH